eukprot:834167-Pelagomonas_calceolata.AAC.2
MHLTQLAANAVNIVRLSKVQALVSNFLKKQRKHHGQPDLCLQAAHPTVGLPHTGIVQEPFQVHPLVHLTVLSWCRTTCFLMASPGSA